MNGPGLDPEWLCPLSQLAVRTSLFIQRLKLVLCLGCSSVSAGEQPRKSMKNQLAEVWTLHLLHHPRSPPPSTLASAHSFHKNKLTLISTKVMLRLTDTLSMYVYVKSHPALGGVCIFARVHRRGHRGSFGFFNFQFQTLSFRVTIIYYLLLQKLEKFGPCKEWVWQGPPVTNSLEKFEPCKEWVWRGPPVTNSYQVTKSTQRERQRQIWAERIINIFKWCFLTCRIMMLILSSSL